MDKIGSSHIVFTDMLIVFVAIVLYWCLTNIPPNTLPGRIVALICGLAIASIILVIPLADSLTSDGVRALAYIGAGLAWGLWQWNKARAKSNYVG